MKILKNLSKYYGLFLLVIRYRYLIFRKIIEVGFAFSIIRHTFVPLNCETEQTRYIAELISAAANTS